MNSFVLEKWIVRRKVTFFSVTLSEDELSLADQFYRFCESNLVSQDLGLLLKNLLVEVGDIRGANANYFREEYDLISALPNSKLKSNFPVRWICMRLDYDSIVLFDGGLKLSKKNSGSPDLDSKYQRAIKMAKAIEAIMLDKDDNRIEWNTLSIVQTLSINVPIKINY